MTTTMLGETAMRMRVVLVAVCLLAGWTFALAQQFDAIQEILSGFEEDPLVLSTTGHGEFRARINDETQQIAYTLSYADLEGAVLQAHIHLGGKSQSGGIAVFLCTNLGNGPAGTQACPAAPATISGIIRPADVIGPAGQGITAGQFAELINAIQNGV